MIRMMRSSQPRRAHHKFLNSMQCGQQPPCLWPRHPSFAVGIVEMESNAEAGGGGGGVLDKAAAMSSKVTESSQVQAVLNSKAATKVGSHWRDCHCDDTPSPSLLAHQLKGEGGAAE